MSETLSSLRRALLAPRSVAIVGQSNDPGKTAGRPLKYLRQAGYGGRIYPINPGARRVLGERAWPSLAALPEMPDHAYIVTPTEAGDRGGRRMRPSAASRSRPCSPTALPRLAKRATRAWRGCGRLRAQTGIRIVGPSSLGVVDLRAKTMLTANAAFDEIDIPVGRIFAASHSRQHDRRAAFAREGPRRRLCRSGFGRQRDRPLAR